MVKFAYYTSAECPKCGEETFTEGLTLSTLEHNGFPVIPFDDAAQQTFHCPNGHEFYTSDFELFADELFGDTEDTDG